MALFCLVSSQRYKRIEKCNLRCPQNSLLFQRNHLYLILISRCICISLCLLYNVSYSSYFVYYPIYLIDNITVNQCVDRSSHRHQPPMCVSPTYTYDTHAVYTWKHLALWQNKYPGYSQRNLSFINNTFGYQIIIWWPYIGQMLTWGNGLDKISSHHYDTKKSPKENQKLAIKHSG